MWRLRVHQTAVTMGVTVMGTAVSALWMGSATYKLLPNRTRGSCHKWFVSNVILACGARMKADMQLQAEVVADWRNIFV